MNVTFTQLRASENSTVRRGRQLPRGIQERKISKHAFTFSRSRDGNQVCKWLCNLQSSLWRMRKLSRMNHRQSEEPWSWFTLSTFSRASSSSNLSAHSFYSMPLVNLRSPTAVRLYSANSLASEINVSSQWLSAHERLNRRDWLSWLSPLISYCILKSFIARESDGNNSFHQHHDKYINHLDLRNPWDGDLGRNEEKQTYSEELTQCGCLPVLWYLRL